MIWYMVPEISTTTYRVFSHLWPFFALLPANSPQNENIKKKWNRNTWRYHRFTEVYQKSWLYPIMFPRYCMMPWRMTDIIIIFPFGLFFALLPPNSPKNENFQKIKKHLEISSFYTSASKIVFRSYTVPEIWHVMDVIVVFHFGQFFALLPH